MKKRQGFTLAEVLVVMAVLGVLGVILIPSLTTLRPNQEMVMLKKAYYLTSRTVNELINDDDFYPDEDKGFNDDTTEAKYHGAVYSGETKFCNLFAARLNLRNNADCTNGKFTTADGMSWELTKKDNIRTFTIDVNGPNKGSNCLEDKCNGKNPDKFQISFDQFGVITVPDGIEREYLSTNDTTKTYRFLKEKHDKAKKQN